MLFWRKNSKKILIKKGKLELEKKDRELKHEGEREWERE